MTISWNNFRLKYLVRLINEKAEPNEKYPYIGLNAVKSWTGKINLSAASGVKESVGNRFHSGDILFGKMGPHLAKVAIPNFSGQCTSELFVLRPWPNLDTRFLRYLLVDVATIDLVSSSVYGATMPRTSWNFMGDLRFNIPDLATQKIIADFLDRKTIYIYQLIEKKEKLISLLIEKRKSMISFAVTGQKEHNQNESVEKQIHQTFEKNIDTKEPWNKFRLKYLLQLIVDKVNFSDEDCPYIGLDAITQWTGEINLSTSDTVEESTGNRFYPGDILFGKLRPYLAKVATPNFLGQCSSEALVLRPYINVDTQFLRYRLVDVKTIDLINSSTYGTKMPRSSWDFIGNIYFNIPKLTTQKIIADFLNIETKKLDQTIKKTKKSIELLKEFRASLITAAVTGQLDIHKQKK